MPAIHDRHDEVCIFILCARASLTEGLSTIIFSTQESFVADLDHLPAVIVALRFAASGFQFASLSLSFFHAQHEIVFLDVNLT